jgi:flagellar FliL protein
VADKDGKALKDGKDGKNAKDAAAAPAKPKLGKKKLIIIAAAATVLTGGTGAGAWLMLDKGPDATAEKKPEQKKTPVFVELDTFTVNLRKDSPDDGERFMQVKLVAEVKDAPTGEIVKNMMPAVRSEIILLLGSKRAEDIASREGKEQLAGEIVLAANKPLDRTPAEKGVEGVNFTHIIVQ